MSKVIYKQGQISDIDEILGIVKATVQYLVTKIQITTL